MNPLARAMVVSGLLILAHSTAMAQTQPPACPLLEKPSSHVAMVIARTGCPLSAAIQVTITQILADGTHIQTNFKALVYRDSLERIRYETYAPADTMPNMIEISDPVGGFSYFILPQKDAVAYRKVRSVSSDHEGRCARSAHAHSRAKNCHGDVRGAAVRRCLGDRNENYKDDSSGRRRQRPCSHNCKGDVEFARYRHYASGENLRLPKRGLRKASDESGADGARSNSVSGASGLHDPGSISVLASQKWQVLTDALIVHVGFKFPVTRLSRNLLISPFKSDNRPGEVPGTSDASKTQSGLVRS